MHLRAISAIVHDNDENIHAVALDRFQFLDVHEHAAVAVVLDADALVEAALDVRDRAFERKLRLTVTDRAVLADRQKAFISTRWHLRKKCRAMPGRVDQFPPGGQGVLKCCDCFSGVEQSWLHVEFCPVGRFSADAIGKFVIAPTRCTRGQRRRDRLDAKAGVSTQVMAGDSLALTHRTWRNVDMQHFSIGPQLSATARVESE